MQNNNIIQIGSDFYSFLRKVDWSTLSFNNFLKLHYEQYEGKLGNHHTIDTMYDSDKLYCFIGENIIAILAPEDKQTFNQMYGHNVA